MKGLRKLCLFKQNTDISHTGTTAETIVFSSFIEAGTLDINDILRFYAMFEQTNNANVKTCRIYFNTTNNLTGSPIQVATRLLQNNTGLNLLRNLIFKNSLTTQNIIAPTTNYSSSESISNLVNSTLSIDFSVSQYFIVSIQLANSADTVTLKDLIGEIKR